MKKRISIVGFILVVALSVLVSCGGNANNSKSKTQPSKTVFTYDEGTIILNDNPKTASVNGLSGSWSYVEDQGRRNWPPQPYYVVWYGDKVVVISEGKGMIYFGTEDEAARDQTKAYKWHEYRKHRE